MERVSRRRLLTAGGSAALASAVVGGGMAAAQTLPPGRPLMAWLERYVLVTEPGRVDTARQALAGGGVPTGPAYFTGSIYRTADVNAQGAPTGNPVGTYRLTGWVYSGGAVPFLVGIGSFDFAGRGKITATGMGGPVGSLAVVGGTGEFMQVGGEARTAFVVQNNVGAVVIEFDLTTQSVGM
jgi:hypothetical protein